jgi:hypothetical protein
MNVSVNLAMKRMAVAGFAEILMSVKHSIYAPISALILWVLISVFAKQAINWVKTTVVVLILTNALNILRKQMFRIIPIFVAATVEIFPDLSNARVLMVID